MQSAILYFRSFSAKPDINNNFRVVWFCIYLFTNYNHRLLNTSLFGAVGDYVENLISF